MHPLVAGGSAMLSFHRGIGMTVSRTVVLLSILIAFLALIATGAGLRWPHVGSAYAFTTLRGTTVQICGHGLYRFDSLFSGAGYQGQDFITLALAIPLLLLAILRYRRGTLNGGLLLSGILAYFLYVYASMALGASYNSLFLVYVALFSTSFFAFVLTFVSCNLDALPVAVLTRLPRRGPAIFLLASGVLTLLVWLGPLLSALHSGTAPALLGNSSTMVTDALDLGLITPANLIAGMLILQRRSLGYRLAFPLCGIIVLLLPVIVLSTLLQSKAGITFTLGEMIGPISGFAMLGVLAIWVMIAILRCLPTTLSAEQDMPEISHPVA